MHLPPGQLQYGQQIRPRPLIRRLLPWVIAVPLVVFSCAVWLPKAFEPRVGQNVSRERAKVRGLPLRAANVSYHIPGAFGAVTAFEFDVPEDEFLSWAASDGWNTQPIPPGEPFEIYRFDNTRTLIRRGHFYRWTEEDRGRHVAYDSDAGRAYYYDHTR